MPDDLKEANIKKGMQGENYFASILNSRGIENLYVNSWYDYLVNNEKKVEVKSCELIVKNNIKKRNVVHRMGQFIFKLKEAYEQIVKENIWICFVIRHKEQFMILGFCRAKDLPPGMRSISLSNIPKCNLISLDDWLKEILR